MNSGQRKPLKKEIKGGEQKEVGLKICLQRATNFYTTSPGKQENYSERNLHGSSKRDPGKSELRWLGSVVCTHGRMWVIQNRQQRLNRPACSNDEDTARLRTGVRGRHATGTRRPVMKPGEECPD